MALICDMGQRRTAPGEFIRGKTSSAISGNPHVPFFLLFDDADNELLVSARLEAYRILILSFSAVSLKDQSAKGDFIRVGYTRQRKLSHHQLLSDEGIDFVRCRICGDHRRVLSGRHLSKHDIDRETYMQEYDLSPDELIAKTFRIIQSSHPGYYPHSKEGWIAAMQKVYGNDGKVFAKYLQHNYPQLYSQGGWIFGDWDKALRAAGFDPDKMHMQGSWDRQKRN